MVDEVRSFRRSCARRKMKSELSEAEQAESKAAAVTAAASNKRARATFDGQSSDRIAESDVAEETM